MFMKSPVPGYPVIAAFIVLGVCVAATGCIGNERFAITDILVSKFDSAGQNAWSTTIDSGRQDYANAVLETSDNGYAVAGWIADDPRAPAYPRVIRLDRSGKILWDRTLASTSDEAVAIAEAPGGGFVVALKSGTVKNVDPDGDPVWNRTYNYRICSMVPALEGGYALAGDHTFEIDANGTLVWDCPFTSTSILQAADGGFFAEESGVPYTYGTVFRFDAQGTCLWTAPVTSHEMGVITSLHETPEGAVEVVYTYPVRTRDKDLIQYMESEQITFGTNGTITEVIPLVAVDPLTRTPDGGYVFLAYPFPGSAAFTSFPQSSWDIHLVRLSRDRSIVWDEPLSLGKWKAPQSVVPTKDGGFLTLVVRGS
jgi:hypothetical protein